MRRLFAVLIAVMVLMIPMTALTSTNEEVTFERTDSVDSFSRIENLGADAIDSEITCMIEAVTKSNDTAEADAMAMNERTWVQVRRSEENPRNNGEETEVFARRVCEDAMETFSVVKAPINVATAGHLKANIVLAKLGDVFGKAKTADMLGRFGDIMGRKPVIKIPKKLAHDTLMADSSELFTGFAALFA